LSYIYLVALGAVGATILAMVFDAVLSVSRKPKWESIERPLSLVAVTERRTQSLPFVGTDRRRAADNAAADKVRLAA